MNIDAYLDRIRYDGPLRRDAATLTALHRAHLLAIPYENLDVQFGRPLTTAIPAIFDKIVTRRRGGWCYEMNGLFGWALAELGFEVTRCAGAVLRESRGDESIGNHLVLKVRVDEGTFLADVGFGDGPIDPIAIVSGPFVSHGFEFALAQIEGDGWWRLRHHAFGGVSSFDFTLAPADETLLSERCALLQSSPQSPFVQNAVLQHHVGDGVWQMRGRVLRKTTPAGKTDRVVDSAAEYVDVLSDIFKLGLPEAADLWPKICARHEELLRERDGSPVAP
ncbi:arylamine N-acetyltransferase family protein [Rhizomicrobium electricum]|uniref:Arylamine N-acetyltransferase n=1 Tax=Rhizomicrobium electricum TaxID=480070 RepID=A0ABN1F0X2_9PROT|nr:arylamine N-acetyltransferase [Rhizomicrobium electricum]NIJ50156.1 N-hydroxyarylamine O-acetyltransferase [Rhizomicrobium electricum]